MANIQKIVMPTDFSENANQALRYAAAFAKRCDAHLTMFHVITLFQDDPYNAKYYFSDPDETYGRLEENVRACFGDHDTDLGRLQVDRVVVRGLSPAQEIIEYAESDQSDLVIMGTHGRSAISHFLMGSVAERVARHASRPVMTVAHQQEAVGPPVIRKVLVPIDFSEYSRSALQYLHELTQDFDFSVDFLHVVEQRVHPAYYATGEESIFRISPGLLQRSQAALKDFTQEVVSSESKAEYHIMEGSPHSEIVKHAHSNEVDMILMATHGLSGLDRMLIGSTTEKVLRRAHCPVLTMRPDFKPSVSS